MADTSTQKPNLGPGQLMPIGNNPFLLSTPQFIAVQTYVEAGSTLPASQEDMQVKLGISPKDAATFDDLILAYKGVATHCSYFKRTTFPMSVELAGDIVHYNTKVPIYYGALTPIINGWNDGTLSPDLAKAKLDAILKNLLSTAKGYATNATTVKEKMNQFVQETTQDQSNLAPVKKRYEDILDGEHGEIQTYRDMIENAKDQIHHWNEEYQKDVTIAATTATYAWIWPAGTIAAAVVAGVYGKRAQDALDNIHEFQDKLASSQTSLKKALTLQGDLTLADTSLTNILTELKVALPVLQQMEGIWGAIAKDLSDILQVIDQDIDQAPAIIKDLGVAEAIIDWEKVARIADSYRANAYITVTTEDEIKKDPSKYALPTTAA
jgi:Bacillus haemolytic enterotoxin (HBL)